MRLVDRLRASLWQVFAGASGLFGLLSIGSVHQQHMSASDSSPIHVVLAVGFGVAAALEWIRRHLFRREAQD